MLIFCASLSYQKMAFVIEKGNIPNIPKLINLLLRRIKTFQGMNNSSLIYVILISTSFSFKRNIFENVTQELVVVFV